MDGLGRTAFVELAMHLLSGTTSDSFLIKINDSVRNQVLVRDQEGEAKDVFFRGKALETALQGYPARSQFYTSMLSEVTNNFTADLTQQSIINFPFPLRKKIDSFVKLVPFISVETGESSEISILFTCFEIDWNDTTQFSSGPIGRSPEPIRCAKKVYKMPSINEQQGYHNKVTPKISNCPSENLPQHHQQEDDYNDEMDNIRRRLQELEPIGEHGFGENTSYYEDDNSTLLTYDDEGTNNTTVTGALIFEKSGATTFTYSYTLDITLENSGEGGL